MKREYEINSLLKSLNHANPDMRAFHSVLTALPCMSHGEMRISLITLNKIFIEGYSNCVEGSTCSYIGGTGPARFTKCIEDIENIVSKYILGEEFNPVQ